MTRCAFCATAVSVRWFPMHRDGYECGPLVSICYWCALVPSVLLWDRIAQPSTHPSAFKPVHAIRMALPSLEALRGQP